MRTRDGIKVAGMILGALADGGQILKRTGSRIKPKVLENSLFYMVADAPELGLLVHSLWVGEP